MKGELFAKWLVLLEKTLLAYPSDRLRFSRWRC